MKDERFVRLMVMEERGGATRTFRLSYRRLRWILAGGLLVVATLAAMAGSWWYLAARAARVPVLEAQVTLHQQDQIRVEALADQIAELEARYAQIRALFGPDGPEIASDLWLPPPSPRSGGGAPSDAGEPASWPLTQRGFVTQGLLEGDAGQHPGVDIAVPAGSYIRASGAGAVAEVGEDPVYGQFVVLDHAGGYRTLYAHAAETFVEAGQRVRRNEVIALSGSTGRSTAPHLHFEVLLDGEAVDPLTWVRAP